MTGSEPASAIAHIVKGRLYLKLYEYLQRIHLVTLLVVAVTLLVGLMVITFAIEDGRYVIIGSVDGRPVPVSPADSPAVKKQEASAEEIAVKMAQRVGSLSWEDREEGLMDIMKISPPPVFYLINKGLESHDLLNSGTMLANGIHAEATVKLVREIAPSEYELTMERRISAKGNPITEKEYYVYITVARTNKIERYPYGAVVVKYVESPIRLTKNK